MTNSPIPGTRFNTYDGTSAQTGAYPPDLVPNAPEHLNLHYDVTQILTVAQRDSIEQSRIMAFHTFGDSGTDHKSWHNGTPSTRLAVAHAIEAECEAKDGKPDNPCFCYHLGDVIYPAGSEELYEDEFYIPFSGYGNAILAIPGNHDFRGDRLASFKKNFLAPSLELPPNGRAAMNLPWFYWVLDTPVATIIGIGSVSRDISPQQAAWFTAEMAAAPKDKALIVASHYAPYCFDHSNNVGVRNCIASAIATTGRRPDLVIAGHSHTYQRMTAPEGYPVLVVGTGGVSTSHVASYSRGGATLLASSGDVYGALTLTVDANPANRGISGHFIVADSSRNGPKVGDVLDRFHVDW